MLTIGKLAKYCQINVETIRYYQRIGLMRVPETTQSYRYYNDKDIETLSFIQKAKDAGLQLNEIQELLSKETKGEMDNFIKKYFDFPPEYKEFFKNKPILIV